MDLTPAKNSIYDDLLNSPPQGTYQYPKSYFQRHLKVDVAKWSTNGGHQILDRTRGTSSVAELDQVVKSAVRARWVVKESPGAGNGVLAVLRRERLPDPPAGC